MHNLIRKRGARWLQKRKAKKRNYKFLLNPSFNF